MAKLLEVPGLLSYIWEDSQGQHHVIEQHEGGEQGDPLMSLLFSLAIHNALAEVKANLRGDEHLFAFHDDVYVLTLPERSRDAFNLLGEKLSAMAEIQLHSGKTRTWNKAGIVPQHMNDVGDEVWSPESIKILCTPVGCEDFVRQASEASLDEEHKLWEAISWVPDVQCGWQDLGSVRRTTMPSPFENTAAQPVNPIRHRA